MARKNKSKTVYLSPAGQVAINKELAELITRRPEMIELINASKELGSSDDNADLDEVRRQQGFLEGRIGELQALLHEAEIITVPKTRNKIMLGSTVELSSAEGPDTYMIVGRTEANPARGLISNESPLGLALLSHKVGETVLIKAPAGEFSYKIEKIENLGGPIEESLAPLAMPETPSPAAVSEPVKTTPSPVTVPTLVKTAPSPVIVPTLVKTTRPSVTMPRPSKTTRPSVTMPTPSKTISTPATLPESKEPDVKTVGRPRGRPAIVKNKNPETRKAPTPEHPRNSKLKPRHAKLKGV